jgi:hypothetical protein
VSPNGGFAYLTATEHGSFDFFRVQRLLPNPPEEVFRDKIPNAFDIFPNILENLR